MTTTRPHRPRHAIKSCICILPLLAGVKPVHARIIFAESQVLPSNRTVDLLVWLPEGDPALLPPIPVTNLASEADYFSEAETAPGHSALHDSAQQGGLKVLPESRQEIRPGRPEIRPGALSWDCTRTGGTLRLSGCQVLPLQRGGRSREQYLYWAFLNLSNSSRRGDLAAREDHRPYLDGLARPLIAFKKQKDSCHYLIVHKDSYAPSAAGKVSCPDLSTALTGLEADLAGRSNLSTRMHVSQEEKVVRRSGVMFADRPRVLDLGFDAAMVGSILLSGDKEEKNGPFTVKEEKFDLDDLVNHAGPPLAGRIFVQYRKLVGFRLGYEYARFTLEDDIMFALRDEANRMGRRLDDWRIGRHSFSGELLLGKGFRSQSAEAYLGAFFGLSNSRYSEEATLEGNREDVDGLLKNVTGVLLGAQAQLRLLDLFLMGLEAGTSIKDFSLKNSTRQPDGSGSEIQLRLVLGFFHSFKLSTESQP